MLVGEPLGGDAAVLAGDRPEEGPMADPAEPHPGLEQRDGAGFGAGAAADFDLAPAGLAGDLQQHAAVVVRILAGRIDLDPACPVLALAGAAVEADDLGAAQSAGEAERQDGAVAQAAQVHFERGEHGQKLVGEDRRLLRWGPARACGGCRRARWRCGDRSRRAALRAAGSASRSRRGGARASQRSRRRRPAPRDRARRSAARAAARRNRCGAARRRTAASRNHRRARCSHCGQRARNFWRSRRAGRGAGRGRAGEGAASCSAKASSAELTVQFRSVFVRNFPDAWARARGGRLVDFRPAWRDFRIASDKRTLSDMILQKTSAADFAPELMTKRRLGCSIPPCSVIRTRRRPRIVPCAGDAAAPARAADGRTALAVANWIEYQLLSGLGAPSRRQGRRRRGRLFRAGAGLALLDRVLRSGEGGSEPVFVGVLRQRLALKAAAASAKILRLREDEGGFTRRRASFARRRAAASRRSPASAVSPVFDAAGARSTRKRLALPPNFWN